MNKLNRLYNIFLLFLIQLVPVRSQCQDTLSIAYVDISRVSFTTSLSRTSASAFIPPGKMLITEWKTLAFQKGMIHAGTIPGNDVARKAIMRFNLVNRADSAVSVWFFPGFYYSKIDLFRQNGGRLEILDRVEPNVQDRIAYRKITLDAHDSATYYAELVMVKTHINTMRPRLIHVNRVESFIKEMQDANRINNTITYLFSGLLLMMILYSLVQYVQGANKEFLYYAGYAFLVGGMLFTKALYHYRPNYVGYFLEGYFDYIMQSVGIAFYMLFMRRFLNTRTGHPFLFKLYNVGIILLLISIVAFTYFHFFTPNFVAEYWVENMTKVILLILTIIFLVYSVRQWNDKLLRFVFWGNFWLFIFSVLSFLLSTFQTIDLPWIWDSSLLHYEIGLFLELLCFFLGLNYKNRQSIIRETRERERLKTENQMKEYEKELAVYKAQQEERQRISADMHDELGAGMTAIRLMSEIARNKMKESTPVEIERISQSADEVLNKMNAIIWSMNSGNDTLDNLVSYIRSYALEYFESTPVECKVNTPLQIEGHEITGDKRRNIFLCVKETLNNVLKHSNASKVTIDFHINDSLTIKIQDNGVGIDVQKLRQFGNGLKNIARRMESIGGTYRIENHEGTLTTLNLPL